MIDSLLVANRGEIACRIFRTARRLGIRTIAVFSEADAGAKHVREADTAVCIGAAAAKESYLNIPRLLEAAASTGARAIHPGYGFLSENADFARRCTAAGLTFIGPPAAAIAAMGSKIVAKARMRAAGVPVLPGYDGTRQDLVHLEEQACKLSLPLMIKPASGGGGKGMQIVTAAAQIAPALAAARRLAEGSFGDGALLLERYLAAPRHVEVQIFADAQGHTVHLGDRDCSIQRRHQKQIEEAIAPELPDEVRARLRAAAILVASEIGYVGAGTVEFLFDAGEFYFMEMNTRLQVEHTVTEAVTGLDLVEWQLRVAGGEPLPLRQDEIRFSGHAIEARVCAEDPEHEFLPSAGQLKMAEWPGGEGIRVDAGFDRGDTVPPNYDSLLGKVIAWAPTRTEAAVRLAAALDRTRIAGIRTNERWLARIARNEHFLRMGHSVAFLQQHSAELAERAEPGAEALVLAALVAWMREGAGGRGDSTEPRVAVTQSPWSARDGFTLNLPARVSVLLSRGEQRFEIEVRFERGCPISAQVQPCVLAHRGPREILAPRDAKQVALADVRFTDSVVTARLGSMAVQCPFRIEGRQVDLWLAADHCHFLLDDPRDREYSASAALGGLMTPLPGVVVAVPVVVGQSVVAGQPLLIIEAMKMEHTLRAPHAGTVLAIHCAAGDRVPEGRELLELSEPG